MKQPKDYPMGRSAQFVYGIRAGCILALTFLFFFGLMSAAFAGGEAFDVMVWAIWELVK